MKRHWLIELRIRQQLSQDDIAKMCNTTQALISHIELGRRRPKPELAHKIAEILNFEWTRFYE